MPDDELPDEAPEADALEQRHEVVHTDDVAPEGGIDSLEVPEADALDQQRTVGGDDDDER